MVILHQNWIEVGNRVLGKDGKFCRYIMTYVLSYDIRVCTYTLNQDILPTSI
jgi:hypothetical protein